MEGKSTCEAQWVLDGRFLRQEYTSTFAGKPLTVVRYLGFDRHKGKYVEIQRCLCIDMRWPTEVRSESGHAP